jgi:O-antigen ligase
VNTTLQLISTILSFEAVFCIFLFAGVFKSNPLLAFMPVDLTGLFFVLSALWGIIILYKNKFHLDQRSLISEYLFFAFICCAVASLTWSPGIEYATRKTFQIATLVFWSFTASACIIAHEPKRIKRFLIIIFLLACCISVEAIQSINQFRHRSPEEMADYLNVGRLVGFGLLSVFFYYVYVAKNTFNRLISLLFIIIFMTVLLTSGGRGPFIGSIWAILISLFPNIRFNSIKGFRIETQYILPIFLIFLMGSIAAVYLASTDNISTTLSRLALLGEDGGASVNVRQQYYTKAIELWEDSPFIGHGIGSWPLLIGLGDIRDYPHNIVFEVLVELGLVGFASFFAILFFSIKDFLKDFLNGCNHLSIVIMMLFVSSLTNSMFSGDISDNRELFCMIGLMMSSSSITKSICIHENTTHNQNFF